LISDGVTIEEEAKVFSVGFGYYQDLDRPSIYKGYITRIVDDEKGTPVFI